jgi:hypothetical protein
MKFKEYLINENKSLLSQRIGDILSAVQTLMEDPKNIDKRNKTENIVNQIRRIIHTKWPSNQKNNILSLRKCAANMMMAVDPKKQDRPELDEVLKACSDSLEEIIKNLETPVNNI